MIGMTFFVVLPMTRCCLCLGIKFAMDSLLEGAGFELTVPLGRATASNLFLSPSKHLNPGGSAAIIPKRGSDDRPSITVMSKYSRPK